MRVVEAITTPAEFKDLCDRLLRHEFGHLFQSFAGLGADGGIDGLWAGTVEGIAGDWVFQYRPKCTRGDQDFGRSPVSSGAEFLYISAPEVDPDRAGNAGST